MDQNESLVQEVQNLKKYNLECYSIADNKEERSEANTLAVDVARQEVMLRWNTSGLKDVPPKNIFHERGAR